MKSRLRDVNSVGDSHGSDHHMHTTAAAAATAATATATAPFNAVIDRQSHISTKMVIGRSALYKRITMALHWQNT